MKVEAKKDDRRYFYRARDAITGHFVSMDYAKANPSTTVVTRVKRAPNKLH